MAWGAVDAINRHFNQSPQVPQGIGYRLIDASHNLGPEGKDYAPPNPPIDLSGTYLKSWGVSQPEGPPGTSGLALGSASAGASSRYP